MENYQELVERLQADLNTASSQLRQKAQELDDSDAAQNARQAEVDSQAAEMNVQKEDVQRQMQEAQEIKETAQKVISDLQVEKTNFEQEKRSVADNNAAPGDVLTINIGGKEIIQVTRDLLTRVKGSTLEAMFSGHHQLKKLENGFIFLDRDADLFQMILSYLRHGCEFPEIHDQVLRKRFEKELRYWTLLPDTDDKIEELCDIVSKVNSEGHVSPAAIEMHTKLVNSEGLWDLQTAIEFGQVRLTQDLPIVKGLKIAPGVLYFGQVPTLKGSFFGRLEDKGRIGEGSHESDPDFEYGVKLQGFGRSADKNGYYIGKRQDDNAHGSGRAVYRDGRVKDGQWANGQFLG